MKTASMVLGIVGGALAILMALYLVVIGNLTTSMLYDIERYSDYQFNFSVMFNNMFLILGIVSGIGGILGLIGGILVKKKNTAGGVLMIIGTVLGFNILLLIGGIFAFVREKAPVPQYAAYPPYPPYPYPLYPQNPNYPNQQQYPPQQNPPQDEQTK